MSLRLKLFIVYAVLVATGALAIGIRALPGDRVPAAQALPVRIWKRTPALIGVLWHMPAPHYRATRAMRVGHRLAAADLAPADALPPDVSLYLPAPGTLVGKYLRYDIARDADITLELVGDALEVWPPTGRELLRVWMGGDQAKLAQSLDVGWTVDVSEDAARVISGARVVGVDCQPGAPVGCVATLAVTSSEKLSFLNITRKDKLTITVSEPNSGG